MALLPLDEDGGGFRAIERCRTGSDTGEDGGGGKGAIDARSGIGEVVWDGGCEGGVDAADEDTVGGLWFGLGWYIPAC